MSDADVLDTRPTKCTRVSADDPSPSHSHSPESSSTPPDSNLQRHSDIWFNDGNIVLVAGGTAFRIYRGLLASQSTVFSDMFASSTSSPDEIFDGCPIIHLSDSPHTLAYLLRVLLPNSRIHYHMTRANPIRTFDELSAVIRLAHKYHISQVQEQALALLKKYSLNATSITTYSSPPPHSQLILDPRLNIGVVNLARLTDTPSLLPLALYCCTYLGGDLFDGWTHEDGTIEHLSEPDIHRCVDARAVLMHEHTLFLSSLFDDTVSADCGRPHHCAPNLRQAQRNAVCSKELALEMDALKNWDEVVKLLGDGGVGRLCRCCIDELLERNEKGRKKIFDKLPEIFVITVEGWGVEPSETDDNVVAAEGE
ncbi:hypothetical protein LXA43DRAFT_882141 [Ganoderma leucocontextum]|nr:hypothetical protein LXA43DRAFT_882141 [Ganoderma leucocontextum]